MKKEEKIRIVDSIKQNAENSSILLIVDFKAMPVEELNALRASLRTVQSSVQVVKNTLARLALSEGTHAVLSDSFKENCAVVYAFDDPIAPVKILVDFAKESKFLQIRTASLDGVLLSKEEIEQLSTLPSREALLSSALGTLNQIPTGFVCIFANLIRSLLYALKAIETKKEA